jgi:hypothetical protein
MISKKSQTLLCPKCSRDLDDDPIQQTSPEDGLEREFITCRGCGFVTHLPPPWELSGLERLAHGIVVLQGLIDRGVNQGLDEVKMHTWGSANDCGTVACIAGWFTLDPVFQAQGLEHTHSFNMQPGYGSAEGWPALELFFGVGYQEVNHIFGSDNTNRLEDAIERIQNILDGTDDLEQHKVRLRQAYDEAEREYA